MARVSDPEHADLFDGFGNGSHHLWVVCEPNWRPYDGGNARYLELDFHRGDWDALFIEALHCPGYDPGETEERNLAMFQQSLREYPMLGRIRDRYVDYRFSSEQVVRLRSECLSLAAGITEPGAVKALRKLIYACDEASGADCDLMFICD